MRTSRLAPLALLAAACVSSGEPQRRPQAAPTSPTQLAELARAQEAASRPGNRHRALDPLVGAWTTTNVAVDAAGHESDPIPGRALIEWALAGRFLAIEASLDLPIGARQSRGYLGWDEAHAEYQWLMVSDLSTGMGVAHGTGELGRGGVRFVLDVLDPQSGGFARAVSVLRIAGPDHAVLEQIGPDANGIERVVRRTHYRRAAGVEQPLAPRS